jgi:hypothetical protein
MPIGYVYMISSSTGNYVGSTIQTVDERFVGHKSDAKRRSKCSSRNVLDGENVSVRTLEEVEYLTDDDELLRQEEQKWIDVTDCVNVDRAYTPDDWLRIFKLESKKLYRETHEGEIKEKMQERYKATREHRLQQGKKYYEQHKEKYIQYQQNRYDSLREYKKQITKCDKCDCELARHSLYLHNKRFHN